MKSSKVKELYSSPGFKLSTKIKLSTDPLLKNLISEFSWLLLSMKLAGAVPQEHSQVLCKFESNSTTGNWVSKSELEKSELSKSEKVKLSG